MTTNEVYKLVELVIERSREQGDVAIAHQLESAMRLGSSGLEILGAIGVVLKANAPRLRTTIGDTSFDAIIDAIERAYGANP